jgi:hypothetical protein
MLVGWSQALTERPSGASLVRINLAFTEDDADETVAAAGSALRRVR